MKKNYENVYQNTCSCTGPSVHAEQMAIDKLPYRKSKKMKKVSLMVIRASGSSKNYSMKNSKPCLLCYSCIMKAGKKGYIIDKIYYSNDNGNIEYVKTKNIDPSDLTISRFYKRSGLSSNLKNILENF